MGISMAEPERADAGVAQSQRLVREPLETDIYEVAGVCDQETALVVLLVNLARG